MLRIGRRYLRPYHGEGQVATTDAVSAGAGRVYLALTEVPEDCHIDQLSYIVGTQAAGSVILGLYSLGTAEDTAAGGSVVVQSAITAQSTATLAPHSVAVTETFIRKGRYYTAFEISDVTGHYLRHANQHQVIGWGQFYDRGGGFGSLTDPCPAVTNTGSNLPMIAIRVSK
jgi:hypothetical protein